MRFATLILASLSVLVAAADPFPSGWAAEKMKPIGYSGLDGHVGAFKIVVRRAGDRWYAYLGHFWESVWIILDVTDAANPKFLKFIPGPDNTNTYQVELHGDTLITALQQRPRNWGGDPKRPNDEGAPHLGCQRSDQLETAVALEDRRQWNSSHRISRRTIFQRGGDHAGVPGPDSGVCRYQ